MKRKLSLLALALATAASAQTPPPGPLIVPKAPEFARWTVKTNSSSAETSGKPARGLVAYVEKTGEMHHITQEEVNGTKIEVWRQGNLFFLLRPEWPRPLLCEKDPAGPGMARADFKQFDWISKANFAGIEKRGGRDCLIFRASLAARASEAPGVPSPGAPPVQTVAWTDLETRLPVAIEQDGQVSAYFFETLPAILLQLPPQLQTASTQWLEQQRRNTRKPVRP
jgi:hypothetical protein